MRKQREDIMIIYFTGTGNSKFVAKNIAKVTGDTTLNVSKTIRKDGILDISDETLVFVCPVYVSAPPIPFMDLIKRSNFAKGAKAYFVVTCGGGMGCSGKFFRDIAEEKGFEYMGCDYVLMPNNYIIYFKMSDNQKNKTILKDSLPVISEIAGRVKEGIAFPEPQMKKTDYIMTKMILGSYYKFFMTSKCFEINKKCVGCGMCERDCPMGNVKIDAGHPVWGDACVHCMACINRCPKEAIEGGKKTLGKVRYHGPEVLLADL